MDVISTPLLAALICSLAEVGLDLPTNEIELYDKRLDLLLGKWEIAKSIAPMSTVSRKHLRHFLMELAFKVHTKNKIEFNHIAIGEVLSGYNFETIYRTTNDLIKDMVERGIFVIHYAGNERSEDVWTFGHLTYQEYLAALWLSNFSNDIMKYTSVPFWEKALLFYAQMKQNLEPFISTLNADINIYSKQQIECLLKMIEQAPLTRASVKKKIKSSVRA